MININIKKQYKQTTGSIQRLMKKKKSFIDCCYCGSKLLFEKMFVCCLGNMLHRNYEIVILQENQTYKQQITPWILELNRNAQKTIFH